MANVWTNGWTAQLKWPKKWRPGNGSEMVGKHASIGRSPSLLHDGNSTNFTRQSKIDGILAIIKKERFSSLDPDLPVRVLNVFERERIETWGDVLDLSPARLLELRNLGKRSIKEFLAFAIRTSADMMGRFPLPLLSSFAPSTDLPPVQALPDPCALIAAHLRQLVRWAHCESEVASVGERFSALPHAALPPDLAVLWKDLSQLKLEGILEEADSNIPTHRLMEELLGLLDERDRFVLSRRISSTDFRTGNELAEELGVSPQRVRQLEDRAGEKIGQALRDQRFAPIRSRTHCGVFSVALPRRRAITSTRRPSGSPPTFPNRRDKRRWISSCGWRGPTSATRQLDGESQSRCPVRRHSRDSATRRGVSMWRGSPSGLGS